MGNTVRTMLKNSLCSKTTSNNAAPLQVQTSNNTSQDCTSLQPAAKRKNSSRGPSQRKRQKTDEEQRKETDRKPEKAQTDNAAPLRVQTSNNTSQDCTSLKPAAKRKNSSRGPSQRKRQKTDEEQRKETDRKPEKAQTEKCDSKGNESYNDNTNRVELEKKYLQLECLGAGGCGSVYAGIRRQDNLPVAIKHIPIQKVPATTVVIDGEERLFPLEAVLMTMAQRVKDEETTSVSMELLDWYELQGELVLVMERLVPSKDLFEYIMDSGGCLEEEEAKIILKQLVEGMIRIHSNGVLHRDIKPENILIHLNFEGLNLRILDFSCGCTSHEDHYTKFYGTARYTPPEFHMQSSYQAEPCTVWQVGLVLYFMLCGILPFHNPRQITNKTPFIPSRLSPEIQDLLRRCLMKQPEDRTTLHNMLEHPWLTHI